MKVKFRKILAFALVGSIALSMQFTNVHAETRANLTLNGAEYAFSNLFKVKDGKIYVPIRLFYPAPMNGDEPVKKNGIEVSVSYAPKSEYLAISAGKDGQYRGLFIAWSQSVKNEADENGKYVNGRMQLYTYTKDGNGQRMVKEGDEAIYLHLDAPVILENLDEVGGGGRMFVSLNTLETITQFLLGDFTNDGYAYIVETN